jgi:hypothetical protein
LLRAPPPQANLSLELCVDGESNPVLLQQTRHGKKTTWRFGLPLARGPPPAAAFDLPSCRDTPGPPCQVGGGPRFHSASPALFFLYPANFERITVDDGRE